MLNGRLSATVAITGDYQMAKILTGQFGQFGVLFPLLEEPWFIEVDEQNANAKKVLNLLALLRARPERLIIAGCDERLKSMVRSDYAAEIIFLDTAEDLDRLLSAAECPSSVSSPRRTLAGRLAVIEETHFCSAGYCRKFCCCVWLPGSIHRGCTERRVHTFEDLLRDWENPVYDAAARLDSRRKSLDMLRSKLAAIQNELDAAHEVVFFTEGLPYGMIPSKFAASHLWMRRDLGMQILRGEYQTSLNPSLGSAILIDSGELLETETGKLEKMFGKVGVQSIPIRNRFATVGLVEEVVQSYPADLIVITSHAGEIEGERRIAEWVSKHRPELYSGIR